VPGWNAMGEELLREDCNQKPTDSRGGCGSFTIAKDPEYFVTF